MTPQHEYTHSQPGGHSLDDVHVCSPAQNMSSQQKQQPSVVVEQKQQPDPPAHAPAPHVLTQPPASMQAGDPCALADGAVSIDPAPTAAAPRPARFSSRRLETLSSVTAIRETSVSLGMPY